ncbi:MAG TPA: proline dehydrogenase family protein, partial [Bacteroidia bacterium]|nr:proline dehydrogenase family protein [Bacteroidia bacterium]
MVSFENTEIAFSGKTDNDLRRSYWLFRIIGNPAIVKISSGLTNFAIAARIPLSWAIKPTIFKQFVGGENITECNRTIAALAKFNIGTILDYSVEGKAEEEDFNKGAAEIIDTIERAKNDPHIPFSVFKVTGLARLDLLEKVSKREKLSAEDSQSWERVRLRVEKICSTAARFSKPVFIDAEESWIQQAIDDLADEMMEKMNTERPIVYNTFQLYRKDRLAYLRSTFEKAVAGNFYPGAKLVRGAYMEKERERAAKMGYASPIQESKDDTDKDYNEALRFCVEHIDRIGLCAGTHNEYSSMLLVKLMEEKKIPADHPFVCFSQLLGMSDHISYNLANAGYNVAKYVPYGPVRDVLPYLIRRAQENTSVKGQTGRELSLIIK